MRKRRARMCLYTPNANYTPNYVSHNSANQLPKTLILPYIGKLQNHEKLENAKEVCCIAIETI